MAWLTVIGVIPDIRTVRLDEPRRAQVVGPMLRQVGKLAALGIAIGVGGAAAVTPVVGSLLISVTPNDPAGYAAVAVILGIALAATWLPAWRASAVDPVVALREE